MLIFIFSEFAPKIEKLMRNVQTEKLQKSSRVKLILKELLLIMYQIVNKKS